MHRQAPSQVCDDVCNFQLLRDHFDLLITLGFGALLFVRKAVDD